MAAFSLKNQPRGVEPRLKPVYLEFQSMILSTLLETICPHSCLSYLTPEFRLLKDLSDKIHLI